MLLEECSPIHKIGNYQKLNKYGSEVILEATAQPYIVSSPLTVLNLIMSVAAGHAEGLTLVKPSQP